MGGAAPPGKGLYGLGTTLARPGFPAFQFRNGNVGAELRGFLAGSAEGKGAGKFRHHLHPTLLAVFLFENGLLSGEAGEVRMQKCEFRSSVSAAFDGLS